MRAQASRRLDRHEELAPEEEKVPTAPSEFEQGGAGKERRTFTFLFIRKSRVDE
jgi:hypothetical protein